MAEDRRPKNSGRTGQSQHQGIGKNGRQLKASSDVELFGNIVDCMHQQHVEADVFWNGDSAQKRIFEQDTANLLSLTRLVNGQPPPHHDGNRVRHIAAN